ncbi:MAG: hypothetical protein KBC02_02010 [Candidatus Pacebacteria bacterium]|nr:hypothetical protein [Candidatus Paceibacterota bacterium]
MTTDLAGDALMEHIYDSQKMGGAVLELFVSLFEFPKMLVARWVDT